MDYSGINWKQSLRNSQIDLINDEIVPLRLSIDQINDLDIVKHNLGKCSNNSEGSNHKRKKEFHEELINLNKKFRNGCKNGS